MPWAVPETQSLGPFLQGPLRVFLTLLQCQAAQTQPLVPLLNTYFLINYSGVFQAQHWLLNLDYGLDPLPATTGHI